MQLSLLDFCASPAPVVPPAPPAVEASPMWLEPDFAAGRQFPWLMCDGRNVAIVCATTAADGVSDGDTSTVVLWQGDRVVHQVSVGVAGARERAEAEARRWGLM